MIPGINNIPSVGAAPLARKGLAVNASMDFSRNSSQPRIDHAYNEQKELL